LGNFSKQINAYVLKTKTNTRDVFHGIVEEVFEKIVERTPVDADPTEHRGQTKANWQIGEGQAPSGIIEQQDPTGSATIEREVGKLENSLADTIWIVNNEKHTRALEFGLYPKSSQSGKTVGGYSKQAPRGMVRVTLAEYPQIFKKVVREKNK